MHLIITASPNKDGLTAACGKAALDGITIAGGTAELIDISADELESCRICGNGWGSCRDSATCIIDDSFTELQTKIKNAEGVILVTPVYWGQPSERMKYFLDRFRRCEAFNKEGSVAKGKQIDLIAAAGGSGNGTATCLHEMEMWCRHVGAIPKDRIGITQFNREPMLKTISDMASRLVKGEYFKGF
ncbi:MAG: flavodoxin family protein [Defluviitaleaceae bacterium]|nr:flavodoxin family protein [Defluviitaleaceae bacterium]